MDPRTIVVTGGTGALGDAVTKRLLADRHRVAVTWVVAQEQQRSAEELRAFGDRIMFVRADVTDEDSVSTAIGEVREQLGPPEGLVHLVGAWRGGSNVEDHDLQTWRLMLDVNLTSAFTMAKAVLPDMRHRDWGRIVFVSSRTARVGQAGQAGYAASKAAVATLAETIAEETVGTGITANVVAPSTMDTPANRAGMPDADPSRWVTPDDVAAAISFLCSDAGGQLRGAWLPVYGSV